MVKQKEKLLPVWEHILSDLFFAHIYAYISSYPKICLIGLKNYTLWEIPLNIAILASKAFRNICEDWRNLGHVASTWMPKNMNHLCSDGWLSSPALGILVVCWFRAVVIWCRVTLWCPYVFGKCTNICLISIDFFLLDFSPLGNEKVKITCVLIVSIAFNVGE